MLFVFNKENKEYELATITKLIHLLEILPDSETIVTNLAKAWSIVHGNKYDKICVSISGGSDSDLLVDIFCLIGKLMNGIIEFYFFDTGWEYTATKEHLTSLERKYGITIHRIKAQKPVPLSCKQYGIPFLSKRVSEYMMRLQNVGFQWEDGSYEELVKKYCKPCSKEKATDKNGQTKKGYALIEGKYYRGVCSALKWWTNANGENSRFNISHYKYLKEFIQKNPPKIKISNKCCMYAKKNVVHKIMKDYKRAGLRCLSVYGVRKAEGGSRAVAYRSCFDDDGKYYDNYRPLFWFTDQDKRQYEEYFGIEHSLCYKRGLKRTGCCGCPYSRNIKEELEYIKKYEPKFYTACINLFGPSYEYTQNYYEFRNKMKPKDKEMPITDILRIEESNNGQMKFVI